MRLLWVFFLAALDTCPWERSAATPLTAQLQLSAVVNGRNEIKPLNMTFNDVAQRGARQPKFFGLFGQPADTKEFKTGYQLNPVVADRLSAYIPFGKFHLRPPPCDDTAPADSEVASSASSSSSASTFTSSASSSSSSASASASAASSSSASISSSSSGASATDQDASASNAPPGSLPASASISASESQLPTNEQYYPITVSETQTNNNIDIDHNQQHGHQHQNGHHDIFGKFEAKKKWTQIINAPAHALQKMRKHHADAIGLGPLYGTDHFSPRKLHP